MSSAFDEIGESGVMSLGELGSELTRRLLLHRVNITEETNSISLNSVEIEIKDVKYVTDGKTLEPTKKEYDEDRQTDKFTFGETFSAGSKGVLNIEYVGQLNDNMAGM